MKHRVNVGMNYPPEQRAEEGDIVENIPQESLPWLLEHGYISEHDENAPTETVDTPLPKEAPEPETATEPVPVVEAPVIVTAPVTEPVQEVGE